MALINTSLPNLLGGVSQQPDATRFDGQCEEQENALSSVVKGLMKRPPTQFLGLLFEDDEATEDTEVLDTAFVDFIERSADERYALILDKDKLRIFRIEDPDVEEGIVVEASITVNGVSHVNGVTIANTDYLYSATGSQNIKALTIGDTTLLVNTAKAVQKATETTPDFPDSAVVFVKQADYDKNYTVKGVGGSANALTGDNSSSSHANTGPIINGLVTGLNALTNITATKIDKAHMRVVSSVAGGLDGIEVTDDLSGNGLGLAYKEADSISSLPLIAANGMVIKIKGDADLSQDDYYIKFNTTDETTDVGRGTWEETVAPNVLSSIGADAPVQLINVDANAFELTGMPLNSRQAGDNDSNPFPSFVEASISNVFLFKNRLGILSRDSVIMSESGLGVAVNATKYSVYDGSSYYYPLYLNRSVIYGASDIHTFTQFPNVKFYMPTGGSVAAASIEMSGLTAFANASSYSITTERQGFNFFRSTVTTLLDSAPIDVAASASTNSVITLRAAKEFQENLILFSDTAQFSLKGGDILTPNTISITKSTNFDYDKSVEPINLGSYMYFPFHRGEHSGIRDYEVNANTSVYASSEITEHVPRYIPSGITQMTGSDTDNLIAVVTGDIASTEQNTLDSANVVASFPNTSHTFTAGGSLIYHASALNPVQSLVSTANISYVDFTGAIITLSNATRYDNKVFHRPDIKGLATSAFAAYSNMDFFQTSGYGLLNNNLSAGAGWPTQPFMTQHSITLGDFSASPTTGWGELKAACVESDDNAYTIETISTDNSSVSGQWLTTTNLSGTAISLSVYLRSDRYVTIEVGSVSYTSVLKVPAISSAGTVVHYALTGNTSTIHFHANGALIVSVPSYGQSFDTWKSITASPLRYMHTLRIYNKRLTTAQLVTNYNGRLN